MSMNKKNDNKLSHHYGVRGLSLLQFMALLAVAGIVTEVLLRYL